MISFTFDGGSGFEETLEALGDLEGQVIRTADNMLAWIGKDVLPKIVANAPIKTAAEGNPESLRMSIAAFVNGSLIARGGAYASDTNIEGMPGRISDPEESELVITSSAYNPFDGFDYAAYLHENFNWNLGEISAEQPTTPEGGVGPKWIDRTMNSHLSRYMTIMNDAFYRIIKKKK